MQRCRVYVAAAMLMLLLPAPALASASPAATAGNPWPDAAAGYLVRVNGVARWSGNASARLKPASLTKILTALIVLESVTPSTLVSVSTRAAKTGGARIGLLAGMRLRVDDLLAAALLRSANDACVALAEHVAGTEARFVARMNARAAALGLADSHFSNACGFDAPDHFASAHDLARLTDAAMAQPIFATIVARERGIARTQDGREFRFDNTNALLGRVAGTRGVKTGWTKAAGRCLVAVAQRGTTEVQVVLLGAPDRWWDAVAMIESAFDEARPLPGGITPPAIPLPAPVTK